ncbi:hypothetical protein [Methylobacterium oxalidis]|uniref:hypothetical protein n=1 Tax=Methylobacterium oxalidis TaxID=944322 RepID=UPI0033154652
MSRSINTRLAKIEATAPPAAEPADEATKRRRAEWHAAGGPMSFVKAATRAEAEALEKSLRECGMIQAADFVVLGPLRKEQDKPFFRHCIFGPDWGPQKRDLIKVAMAAARAKPPLPLPPGW